MQMMRSVREAGLVPDIDMLATAMDACSKARDTEGAMHFMDQALRLGLEPDDNMFREVREVEVERACVRATWVRRLRLFLIACGCLLLKYMCAATALMGLRR